MDKTVFRAELIARAETLLAGIDPYPWDATGDMGPSELWRHNYHVYAADSFQASSSDKATAEFIAAAPILIRNLVHVVKDMMNDG